MRVHPAVRGGHPALGVGRAPGTADHSFLLAFGVHLNILCIIAQLLLIREELMATKSCVRFQARSVADNRPMKLLRTFPPLKARAVIGITLALVKDIPEDVYRELVAHPVHPVHVAPLPPGM